jgi:hypothetical protein
VKVAHLSFGLADFHLGGRGLTFLLTSTDADGPMGVFDRENFDKFV